MTIPRFKSHSSAATPSVVLDAARSDVLPDGRAAPIYDLTRGVWIRPPSRITRDAGDAADLRQPYYHHRVANTVLRIDPSASRRPQLNPKRAAGVSYHEVVEFLTVTLGLLTFGMVALLLLVLA